MEINIPSLGKVTVLGDGPNDMVRIKLADGRESFWPKAKLPQPDGTETIKVTKIPAYKRLQQLKGSRIILNDLGVQFTDDEHKKYTELANQLREESKQEFKKEWGLT